MIKEKWNIFVLAPLFSKLTIFLINYLSERIILKYIVKEKKSSNNQEN